MTASENSAFMVFWSKDRIATAVANGKIGLSLPALYGGPHTSHPSLRRYRVAPGDRVFPVFVNDGQLFVACCAVVESVDDIRAPRATRPSRAGWSFLRPTCTDDIALLQSASPLRIDRAVPPEALADLRVLSRGAERPVSGLGDGRVKHIAGLQGHYFRLAPATAALFESLAT